MKIGKEIINFIINYAEEMLDEKYYAYYVDEVKLAIDPTVVHIFLYTTSSAEVVKYFTENGLVFSNNVDNCQTMSYRDMLYITIITSKERYEMLKNENYKMESINFGNIVKWAKIRGYKNADIVTLLHKTIICEV